MYSKSIIRLLIIAFLFYLLPKTARAIDVDMSLPGLQEPASGSKPSEQVQNEQQRPLLVIAPFSALGLETSTVQTVELLLRQDILNNSNLQVVPADVTADAAGAQPCMEVDCAVALGNRLHAQQVVVGALSRLGQKVIFQYMLVNVADGKTLVSDNITAETVEDLDTVMKRVALSLIAQKPVGKTAQVGDITQTEAKTPARKSARKYSGISFGYVYPQDGYDNVNRSFTVDFRLGYELTNLTIGSQFAARKGFAANIYSSYLFTRTDVCPYLGGAFGFHWVNHDPIIHFDNGSDIERDKKSDGFEILANAGLRLFRTYNFEVLLNLDYSYTFNDYHDKALIFTIGILK